MVATLAETSVNLMFLASFYKIVLRVSCGVTGGRIWYLEARLGTHKSNLSMKVNRISNTERIWAPVNAEVTCEDQEHAAPTCPQLGRCRERDHRGSLHLWPHKVRSQLKSRGINLQSVCLNCVVLFILDAAYSKSWKLQIFSDQGCQRHY